MYFDFCGSLLTIKASTNMPFQLKGAHQTCIENVEYMSQVLSKFDEQRTGSVSERSLLSASAACNILMSDKERDYVLSTLDPHATHSISIAHFLHEFCGQ